MKLSKVKLLVFISILVILVGGHYFAMYVSQFENAYLYVIAFYWSWIFISIVFLLKRSDLKDLYKHGVKWYWNFLPLILIIPAFITVFIPNFGLLKVNKMLALHLFLSLINPWFEETYWRGLISKSFDDNKIVSFLVSCIPFAISHPFLLGVKSQSLQGWQVLAGTFATGAVWWVVFHQTKTLRGNIITHFIVNIAGMTAYVLANIAVTNY
jgi:membrane protease YdiL (CAAX protease family)